MVFRTTSLARSLLPCLVDARVGSRLLSRHATLRRSRARVAPTRPLDARLVLPVLPGHPPRRWLATTTTPLAGRRPFVPSPEQQAIVELARTQNVVVSARPGAGKTATAEALVAANPDAEIALVTYSKRLQLETATRLQNYGTCDVYTFHGMAGKLFNTVAYNDGVLRDLRRGGVTPSWSGRPYDMVILDELQDCTEALYWLLSSFISAITHAAAGRAPRIVCLGDERQAIYNFRGADARFLSLAPSVLDALSPHPWAHMPLSKSFRLSHQTANFVNQVYLAGEEYVTGSHHGPKPLYLHANPFRFESLAAKLVPLIRKYGPEKTGILAPFVRNNDGLSRLTNLLSEKYHIGVAVSVADEAPLDPDVIFGKVCVSTYHQFKGNERDLVIVYGADAGYFRFFGRDLPDDTCPNTIFVALTRAVKQLVVIHHDDFPPMPFVPEFSISQAARYENLSAKQMLPPNPVGRPQEKGLQLPRRVFVSDMARHIPDEVLDDILGKYIHIKHVAAPLSPSQHITAPDKTLTDEVKMLYEGVSDLNGLAVVAASEYALRSTLVTLGIRQKETPGIPSTDNEQATWLCRMACAYDAKMSGYKSRQVQMADHAFDWLGPYLDAARQRLLDQIQSAGRLEFEPTLHMEKFTVAGNPDQTTQVTKILGRADIIVHGAGSSPGKRRKRVAKTEDEDICIWEVKFVGALSNEHVVQACVYAYLWAVKNDRSVLPRICLFNIRDGEKWELSAPGGADDLRKMVEEVLRAKYSSTGEITTDEFLKRCGKVMRDVERLWEGSETEESGRHWTP